METTQHELEQHGWFAPPQDLRPRYRVARVGFALSALGLGMLALSESCFLLAVFGNNRNLLDLQETRWWDWLVSTPLTWGTFLGSALFLGRFDDPKWRKRAVVLFVMNSIDLATWCLYHSEILGLGTGPQLLKIKPLLAAISPFMNPIELLLFAGLALDVCLHLGRPDAATPYAAARTAAGVSLALALVLTLGELGFVLGGGMQPRQVVNSLVILAWLGSKIGLAAATYFTTYLMLLACQQCSVVLRDLEAQRLEDDPFAR